jgi:hypothetical protein
MKICRLTRKRRTLINAMVSDVTSQLGRIIYWHNHISPKIAFEEINKLKTVNQCLHNLMAGVTLAFYKTDIKKCQEILNESNDLISKSIDYS